MKGYVDQMKENKYIRYHSCIDAITYDRINLLVSYFFGTVHVYRFNILLLIRSIYLVINVPSGAHPSNNIMETQRKTHASSTQWSKEIFVQ